MSGATVSSALAHGQGEHDWVETAKYQALASGLE
jgi:hypothetical protein